MNHFIFHSIKGKLFMALIMVFSAAFAIQIFYMAPKFQARKIEAIKVSQNQIAKYLAGQINSRLEAAAGELEAMASSPAFVALDKWSVDEAVKGLNLTNHFFNYYFVTNTHGEWISYPTQPQLVGKKIPVENMDWVNRTVETGKTIYLDMVKSKIGTLVSGFSTPIRDKQGTISAILRGVFVLSEENALVKSIENAGLLQNSHTYLVCSRGGLIAHSHQKLDYDAFSDYSMVTHDPVEKVIKGQSGIVTYSYDNKKWIASFHPIGMTNWGLIAQQPLENAILAAKSESRFIVVVILGCFFIGLLIAGVWIQKSLTPLFKLVKEIQEGSFDNPPDYPRDEIGQLALKYRNLFTELHQSNRLIQQSETKFRTLFNSANDAIYIINLNGQFLEVNQKAIDSTQYSREELLQMNIADITAQTPAQILPPTMDDPENGKKIFFETSHRTKTGDLIPVEISTRYIEYMNTKAILRVARDLTERKRFEETIRLTQNMEAIGTLAGGIAHDFNNILSGIFGFSQLAKRHLKTPEKAENDIDQIMKGAQKATDLVQQILTVSRKSKHEKKPISVYLIVKEALKLLRATIPATIEIKADIVSKAAVMANPSKIHQIIMNLVTNAYHAMGETGGTLSVGLKEIEFSQKKCIPELNITPGKYLDLEVRDTGHGMDSMILKKIFDPYFTTKAPGKGTGLGLAVVFGIVEEYNGHIRVHSEPGQGSIFHVYLPIIHGPAGPHFLKQEAEVGLSGRETILFVDDNEELREVTYNLLKGFGYTVLAFSSGAGAFETYQKDPDRFDLVVTDMTMPGMTGLALSQKILELRPEQPVILCTGHSDLINREKALSMGLKGYFEKPMITLEFAKVIRSVLDQAQDIASVS